MTNPKASEVDVDKPTQKACIKCGETKPLDAYYLQRGKPQARCKACVQARNRAYAKANPEKGRAATKRWQQRNLDKVRASNVAWYQANKQANLERVREWKQRNPERWRELQARWRDVEQRRVEARERTSEWRTENPDRVAAWIAANPHKVTANSQRRRARKAATAVGPVDLKALWASQNGLCAMCLEPIDPDLPNPDPLSKSVDHIIPLSKGGPHVQDNLQYVHLIENLRKGAKPPY